MVYCDDCGELLRTRKSRFYWGSVPVAVSSANVGESVVLCKCCHEQIESQVNALLNK